MTYLQITIFNTPIKLVVLSTPTPEVIGKSSNLKTTVRQAKLAYYYTLQNMVNIGWTKM